MDEMDTTHIYKKVSHLTPVLALLFMGAAGWTAQALSAPITFNTALPVAEGEFIFREQLIVNQSGDDPSGADRGRRAQAAVSVLGYGVNSKLALFGVLPYRDNELKVTAGGRRRTGAASGFGDPRCLAVTRLSSATDRDVTSGWRRSLVSRRRPVKMMRAMRLAVSRRAYRWGPVPGTPWLA